MTYEIIIFKNLRFFILPINDDESVHICPHLADINKDISNSTSTDLQYVNLILDALLDWSMRQEEGYNDDYYKKFDELRFNIMHSINHILPEPTLDVSNPPYPIAGGGFTIIESLIIEYIDRSDYETAFSCELMYRKIFGKSSEASDRIIKELKNQKKKSINNNNIQLIFDKMIEELVMKTGQSTDYIIEWCNGLKFIQNGEHIQSNYNTDLHQFIEMCVSFLSSDGYDPFYDDEHIQNFVKILTSYIIENTALKELDDHTRLIKLDEHTRLIKLDVDGDFIDLKESIQQIRTIHVDKIVNKVEYELKDFIRKKYISSEKLQSDYPIIYQNALQLLENDVRGIGEINADIFSKMSFGESIQIVNKNRFNTNDQYKSWTIIDWSIVNRLHIVNEFRNDYTHSEKKEEWDKINETSRRVETYMISSKLIEFFEIIRLKLQ